MPCRPPQLGRRDCAMGRLRGMAAAGRKNLRLKLALVALALTGVACFAWARSRDAARAAELRFFADGLRLLRTANETDCRLPYEYDLRDPAILPYVDKPPAAIDCGRPQPYLTHLDWAGRLRLNGSEVEAMRYRDLKCTYEEVLRDRDNDYKVTYGHLNAIASFPIAIPHPVVRVKCSEDGDEIYTMVHAQIVPLSDEAAARNRRIPPERPSVLIFTIDSMSRGNFIRSLPKTHSYLVDRQDAIVFKGLNKVADNTFPNMMALLAGYMAYPRDDMSHMPRWSVEANSTIKRYDDMPIVWRTFAEAGYVTMYCEEYLDAIFSYLDVGFLDDPVDYYYRAAYVSLKENLANLKFNKLRFWNRSKWRYCLANEPSYRYMLNYTDEFLTEMADFRYFALSFFVEMSHEYLTDVKNMDDDLYDFFKRSFERGLFKNTVVLVMGDHGHRFDEIRSTYIGRIEERMPFLGIHLPKSLSHLKAVLKSHTERLLSWYDIHETLVDLALDDLGEKKKYKRPNAIGKSIFTYFDEYRSCKKIGILPEYCTCDREAQILTSSPYAAEAAKLVVEKTNLLLLDSPRHIKQGADKKCAFLTLTKILSASIFLKSSSVEHPILIVRVIVEVAPSGGYLEGAVLYDPSEKPQVYGDINRINKYGDQSACISHDILRLYCYCQ